MRRHSIFCAALALVFLLTQPLGALAAEPDMESPPAESPIESTEAPETPENPAQPEPAEPENPSPEQDPEQPELPEPAQPEEQPPVSDQQPEENPVQPAEPEPPAEPELPEQPVLQPEQPTEPEQPETPEPGPDMEVSQGGQLIFNPYGFEVELEGEVSRRQIVSTKETLTNRGETPVIVRACAVASAPEEYGISFAEAPLDPEAQGKLAFLYVEFQPVSDEPAQWQAEYEAAENQLPAAAEEGEKRQIIVLEPGQSLEYQIFGQAGCNPLPDQPWTGEEWVDLSVLFDFEQVKPEEPEAPEVVPPETTEKNPPEQDPGEKPVAPPEEMDPVPEQPEAPPAETEPAPELPDSPEQPEEPEGTEPPVEPEQPDPSDQTTEPAEPGEEEQPEPDPEQPAPEEPEAPELEPSPEDVGA